MVFIAIKYRHFQKEQLLVCDQWKYGPIRREGKNHSLWKGKIENGVNQYVHLVKESSCIDIAPDQQVLWSSYCNSVHCNLCEPSASNILEYEVQQYRYYPAHQGFWNVKIKPFSSLNCRYKCSFIVRSHWFPEDAAMWTDNSQDITWIQTSYGKENMHSIDPPLPMLQQ